MGGAADLLLVAEEQGVGLGARFAGVEGGDPGDAVKQEPHARLEFEARLVPLWWVDSARRPRCLRRSVEWGVGCG